MPAQQPATIVPSVLDRLIQPVEGPTARAVGWNAALSQLKNSIRRDLEAMLNTRRRPGKLGNDVGELHRSPLQYGIPDFTAMSMAAPERQAAFGRALEVAIREFEPRLSSVAVTLLNGGRNLDRTLRFRVEAVIRLDPSPEPIVFESVLDPVSQTFLIKGDPHA
ncbi:type VI secretion system baseplate subunit TssE [Nitrospirillum sp. BR 11163]|uniref:type VI secretion system baseplate subunit TssE n=1 Tax=Nitrospirillum sp. BR 11163 TaxID=3104323 RepID=UPI002B0008E8|nr:type VI secretion system baseplate subunit TssE [Nitrospirillum sp. BR 11163]MEA1673591.1 type VI secretion system baseplate subunit TssE [Nitrospirillum sp. BR 11163]